LENVLGREIPHQRLGMISPDVFMQLRLVTGHETFPSIDGPRLRPLKQGVIIFLRHGHRRMPICEKTRDKATQRSLLSGVSQVLVRPRARAFAPFVCLTNSYRPSPT
jgi:hypothetical protein